MLGWVLCCPVSEYCLSFVVLMVASKVMRCVCKLYEELVSRIMKTPGGSSCRGMHIMEFKTFCNVGDLVEHC
jgi:hypothetical protein